MSDIKEESAFEAFENLQKKRRRKLLPWWIRFFCWIFMIFSGFAIICTVINLFNFDTDLSLYGLEATSIFSLNGFLIIILMLYKGLAGYLLFFEKDNAILIAEIDGVLGIVVCVTIMVCALFYSEIIDFNFRLELILLIPYIIKLKRIKEEWNKRA